MSEYKDLTTSYGNDAESNFGLDMKWGFHVRDDITPEEILNFFNCVTEIFGRLNVLKAIEYVEENRQFNDLVIAAEYRLNGMRIADGHLHSKYIDDPFKSEYHIRMQPVIATNDADYIDLVLRIDKT